LLMGRQIGKVGRSQVVEIRTQEHRFLIMLNQGCAIGDPRWRGLISRNSVPR
jgi:hypothetical protein